MNTMLEKIIQIFETPLSTMSAAVLLITATTRTAYSIIVLICILWVFFFCSSIKKLAENIIPKAGIAFIDILLSSLAGSIFYLILFLLNPVLAMESELWIILIPVLFCSISTKRERLLQAKLPEILQDTAPKNVSKTGNFVSSVLNDLQDVVSLGILFFLIALIREPLGFASLSLPGGPLGIIEIFNIDYAYPLPVQIISSSAGAFLLLAYILIILRFINGGKGANNE
ncbi:MAG: hypothetical protein Ta2F_07450 [Termitinemataceae bacterium]|nr:MAG: hypothetical protein Ta2F_07450 [Termitinemataceae bacterium]